MAMFKSRGRSNLVRILSAFPSKDLLVPLSADELSTYLPQSGLTGKSEDVTGLSGRTDDLTGPSDHLPGSDEYQGGENLISEQSQNFSLVIIEKERKKERNKERN